MKQISVTKAILLTACLLVTIYFSISGVVNASEGKNDKSVVDAMENNDSDTKSTGMCGENVKWILDSSGVLKITGSGRMIDYTNPNDVPWFDKKDDIISVVIDNQVTNVGECAFYECTNLENAELPISVTEIGESAFAHCSNLKAIVVPDSIQIIGDYAFSFCSALTEIHIPKDIKCIGEFTFAYCSSVTEWKLPKTIKSIEQFGFYYCTGMKTIELPKDLESIGISAFSWSGLVSVTIPDNVVTIDDYAFYYCEDLEEVNLENGVSTIGKYAFYNTAVNEICIPDTVLEINNQTFKHCYCMEKVSLGKGITSIGTEAFLECEELEGIVIPDSVSVIKSKAFYDCENLTSAVIPYTVTSIGTDAFGNDDKLTIYGYSGSVAEKYALSANITFVSLGESPALGSNTESEIIKQPSAGPDYPMVSNNEKAQNYTIWGDIVKSYLVDNGDGTITRVEYSAGVITVEKYDSDLQFLSRITIPMELKIFGGFYSGSEYNFIVFGQENPEEDDDVEVMRVVRYTKEWKRLDSVGLYGANTTIPFDAGSLRMVQNEDRLYIHTCHEMYKLIDGRNHQANLNFVINISTMTKDYAEYMISTYESYVSHSFNQFVLVNDKGNVQYLDHGDGYPRAIALNGESVFDIQGGCGVNATGVSVGGFDYSDTDYLIAGNSVDQSDDEKYSAYSQRNIFIVAVNRDTFEKEIKWITEYDESDNTTISTPQLVKVSSNKFLLIWTEDENVLKYVYLDGNGNPEREIYQKEGGSQSDCQPIYCNDNVIWYTSTKEGVRFYSIDNLGNYNVRVGYGIDAPILTVTNTAKGILAKWTKVSGVDNYNLYYKLKDETDSYACKKIGLDDEDIQLEDGFISYTINAKSNLGPVFFSGAQYEFWVCAYNERIISPKSDIKVSMYFMPKVENVADGIRLYWDEVKGAQNYDIYRETDGSFSKVKAVTGKEWTDTNVSSGEEYRYKIKIYGDREFEEIPEVSVMYVVPPVIKEVTNISKGLKVIWYSVPNATEYKIGIRKLGESSITYVTVDADGSSELMERTITYLLDGCQYEFFMYAYINGNSSAISNIVKCTAHYSLSEDTGNRGETGIDGTNTGNRGETGTDGTNKGNSGKTGTNVDSHMEVRTNTINHKENETVTDISVAKITLGKISYIYNRKQKQPSVTVKIDAVKLEKNVDYIVDYRNNIDVGTASVVVTGVGKYKGKITKTFMIIPKGAVISGKMSVKSKGFTVRWKKQSKSITGFQIQYSTNKNFTKKTTVTRMINKKSAVKLTVRKLKARNKYFVKIRTYKTVKGKKYYSYWSKAKIVKSGK